MKFLRRKDYRSLLSGDPPSGCRVYVSRTVFIVAVLIVGAKAAARSLEVVAIVTATSTGPLCVLIIQIEIVRESVVSRAHRRLRLMFVA